MKYTIQYVTINRFDIHTTNSHAQYTVFINFSQFVYLGSFLALLISSTNVSEPSDAPCAPLPL